MTQFPIRKIPAMILKNDYVFGSLLIGLVVLFGIISYPYESNAVDRKLVPFTIVDNAAIDDATAETDDNGLPLVCEDGSCRLATSQSSKRGTLVLSLSNRRPFFNFLKKAKAAWLSRPRLRLVRFE